MKNKNRLMGIGLLIYFVLSIIDRFVVKISDYIYIPIMIVGIVFILLGLLQNRNEK